MLGLIYVFRSRLALKCQAQAVVLLAGSARYATERLGMTSTRGNLSRVDWGLPSRAAHLNVCRLATQSAQWPQPRILKIMMKTPPFYDTHAHLGFAAFAAEKKG